MTKESILRHVDHTLLKPTATWEEVKTLCEEALAFHTASVCIPASYIRRIKEAYGDHINICTVIGFPLGYQTTASKIFEARDAIKNGASEIDMVINLTDVKNKDYDKVQKEIAELRTATDGYILKVIIETCYLTTEEKIELCRIVTETGADYIKTSTGFGTGGAVMEDILLFKKHIGGNVKIKAAGGIKSKSDMEAFLGQGAERLGTSSAVKLLLGEGKE